MAFNNGFMCLYSHPPTPFTHVHPCIHMCSYIYVYINRYVHKVMSIKNYKMYLEPFSTLLLINVHMCIGDTGLRGPVGEAGVPGVKGAKGDQGD